MLGIRLAVFARGTKGLTGSLDFWDELDGPAFHFFTRFTWPLLSVPAASDFGAILFLLAPGFIIPVLAKASAKEGLGAILESAKDERKWLVIYLTRTKEHAM